jgi:rhodanese-related sulfurtransferase
MLGQISNDGAVELCMNAITCSELRASLEATLVVDVRRQKAYREAGDTIAGALRRDPEAVADWAGTLPGTRRAVVYCVHGHEVSQGVARALAERGMEASFLEGGIEAWKAGAGPLDGKPAGAATRWVTRERPKIDRIACPWLISRFVDRDAEFLYVQKENVREAAKQREAIPYDVAGVHFTHRGELCSFDAFVEHYRLGGDAALERLALIVRGADTGKPELAPQVPGLLAVSQGLSRTFPDDHEMLKHGMVMYDALYAWCREN